MKFRDILLRNLPIFPPPKSELIFIKKRKISVFLKVNSELSPKKNHLPPKEIKEPSRETDTYKK